MGTRDADFDSGPPEPPTTVYIGNLPNDSIQGDVEHIFSNCKVKSIRMVRDRETDAFRGFAYVEFEDPTYVDKALELNGAVYDGRELKIDVAQNRRNANSGFRGRGGDRRGGGGGGPPGYGGRSGGGGGGRGGGGGGGYHDAMRSRGGGGGGFNDYSSRRPGSGPGVGGGAGGGGPSGGGFPTGRRQRQGSGSSGHKEDLPSDNPPPGRPKLKLLPRTAAAPVAQAATSSGQRNTSIFGSGKPRPPTPPPAAGAADNDNGTASNNDNN